MRKQLSYYLTIIVEVVETSFFSNSFRQKRSKFCRTATTTECVTLLSKLVSNEDILESYMRKQITYNMTIIVSKLTKLAGISFAQKYRTTIKF